MKNNLNPLYEGWFSNIFKGKTAKNIEEAKSLYIKDAMQYGKSGLGNSWIDVRVKHFNNVMNENPNVKSIILPMFKRIQNIDEINTFEDYGCVVVGFCEINVMLFKKFGSIYCDKKFKYLVSEL